MIIGGGSDVGIDKIVVIAIAIVAFVVTSLIFVVIRYKLLVKMKC